MIEIQKIPVFNLNSFDKCNFMLNSMNSLTSFHLKNCKDYKTLMQKLGKIEDTYNSFTNPTSKKIIEKLEKVL